MQIGGRTGRDDETADKCEEGGGRAIDPGARPAEQGSAWPCEEAARLDGGSVSSKKD